MTDIAVINEYLMVHSKICWIKFCFKTKWLSC